MLTHWMHWNNRFSTWCYNNYIMFMKDEIKNSPKLFWTYVKVKQRAFSAYPKSKADEPKTATDVTEMCQLFSNYFPKFTILINTQTTNTKLSTYSHFKSIAYRDR